MEKLSSKSVKVSCIKKGPAAVIVVLFAAMLAVPKAVFSGAEDGLLLWFQVIFPTLFPFMLISNLLLRSGGLEIISGILGRTLGALFSTSRNGSFAVLAGFLCGYPMGAKVTADLVQSGRITRTEGAYLLSFCNNTSPAFIMNFIVWKTLKNEKLMAPTLIILTITPVFLSFLFRRYYLRKENGNISSGKYSAGRRFRDIRPESAGGKKAEAPIPFDDCMMNGFEGIVKVGGYIIFFSILLSILSEMPEEFCMIRILASLLEMTNGILIIRRTIPDLTVSYPLILGLSAFGGICSVAQTRCMVRDAGLSVAPYIMQKLAAAAAASLLAFLFIRLI